MNPVDEKKTYESPELIEIGTFEEDTQGWWGHRWDGFNGWRDW